MSLQIALLTAAGQLNIKALNMSEKTFESKIVDSIGLKEDKLGLLVLEESDLISSMQELFDDENKFYPIVSAKSIAIDANSFESMDYEALISLYHKISTRWILNNNIKTIETLYPTVSYLKNLWISDRNSFFDELWFLIKTNLATTNLTIIFNDLKEPTEKQKEKGDKPSLSLSYLQGKKLPNLFAAKDPQKALMAEYENEFSEMFNITEYNRSKGQLVACAKIGLSPVLIMAELPNFNQLQQSILVSLFTGLQEMEL